MSTPYALIPIITVALALYMLTWLAARMSVIRILTHRKIWNTTLLVVFLTTAISGLVLAVQVNFKLQVPAIRELLVWHVDFGIGMTMVAIFHFTWHWTYYKKILQPKRGKGPVPVESEPQRPAPEQVSRTTKLHPNDRLQVFCMGFTGILTQVILLREFLGIFYGSELVVGIVLGNWMVLTGLGAYLGKFFRKIPDRIPFFFNFLLVLACITVLILYMVYVVRRYAFEPGTMASIPEIMYTSFGLLFPFCLLDGVLFTLFSRVLSRVYKAGMTDRVYAFESLGSLAGGLVFSFVLVYFLKSFQSLAVLILFNLAAGMFFSGRFSLRCLYNWTVPAAMILIVLIFVFKPDLRVKQMLHMNQEILYNKETPWGNLLVTRQAEQINFFENNNLLFTTETPVADEETVHYAMLQHDYPRKVLLISGGITGIMDEIRKYPVDRIDYVELNPWIIQIGKKYTDFRESRDVCVYNQDARRYMQESRELYDVILVNKPPPESARINRYFTLEFFREAKASMQDGGVIGIGLPATTNYVSEEASKLNAVLFNTLQKVFSHVRIVPGGKNHFIASDKPLSLEVVRLVHERGIETMYVNEYYLDDQLLKDRNRFIRENLAAGAGINRDFQPLGYFLQIAYNVSFFKTRFLVPGLVLLMLLFILLSRTHFVNLGMFGGGFAASSVEVILLFTFQIIYGYMYHMAGIIIAVFMGGMALGAGMRKKMIRRISFRRFGIMQLLIGLYCLLLPWIMSGLNEALLPGHLLYAVFILLTLVIAVATGILFSLASRLQQVEAGIVSSRVYSIDLIGSASGALLVSVILIPQVGVRNSSLVIAGLNILFGMITFYKSRRMNTTASVIPF